jgi:prephenate dehydratase
MKIAIQGLIGSFHHEAAQKMLPDVSLEFLECQSFREVFASVVDGQADQGVVAVENSLHGPLNAVYRLLQEYHLWIANETTLHIKQYLIGHTGPSVESLNNTSAQILSQAPALAQCEQWLDEHIPLAHRQETHDTAESVRYVIKQQETSLAAIAGQTAAELYGGAIIAGPINDDPHNYTRFVLLQKAPANTPDANRTSIILRTDHTPGALYRALGVFDAQGINLSKLDSHPIPDDTRHYAFYIDFEAGASSPATQSTLEELAKLGYSVKVLGSYHVNPGV